MKSQKTYLAGQVPECPDHDISTGISLTPRGILVVEAAGPEATVEEDEEPTAEEKAKVDEDKFTLEVDGEELVPGPKGDEKKKDKENNPESEDDKKEEKLCFCKDTWHKCSVCGKKACQWCTVIDSDTDDEMKRHHQDCKEKQDGKKPKETQQQEEEDSDIDDPPLQRKKANKRIFSSDEDEADSTSEKPGKDSVEIKEDPMKNVSTDKLGTDQVGRMHFKTSRSGHGYIINASTQLNPSTIEAHVNDIRSIRLYDEEEARRKIVVISADDGEDYSLRSSVTVHLFGRLFRDEGLERLHIVKYAPGQSRLNPVERIWSKSTKDMSHLILDPENNIHLNEDGKKPSENINKDVLEKAMQMVEDSLANFKFGDSKKGFVVTSKKPGSTSLNLNGTEVENNFYSDIEQLRSFYKKKLSKKNRAQLSSEEQDIRKEMKYFFAHGDIRHHMLVFARCPEGSSCNDCKVFREKNPLDQDMKDILGTMPQREMNGALWFEPVVDPEHDGHFKNYIKQIQDFANNPQQKICPDSNLPSGEPMRCQVSIFTFNIHFSP